MKSTAIFVALEYVSGFAFGIAGIFFLSTKDTSSSLISSILYVVVFGFCCMLIGVGFVGYFHLRSKQILERFGKAIMLSFVGSFAFLLLDIVVEKFIPAQLGVLTFIIPLTGAVLGFNLVFAKTTKQNKPITESCV